MTYRSLKNSFLAALLVSAATVAALTGCTTSAIRQPGARLLRSETETAAFREAVEKDRGIPTAAQAGVDPCK